MAGEKRFNEGDVVTLKSGGPKMVVSSIGTMYDEYAVNCEWFSGTKRESASFNAATLQLSDTERRG
jgi:uncharacterized protein YodC (DUF2158 family)